MVSTAALKAFGQKPAAPGKQPAAPSDLSSRIVNGVLSPLAAVGNTLDVATGASSLRDLAVGKNPFDQFATKWWQDAGNRSSGRDVLTHYGLTQPNDPHRWEWGDVGGFLAEVALDPGTYATGFLGGVGKALTGAGKATHLFKVGIPFLSKSHVPVGVNAAKGLDRLVARGLATKPGQKLAAVGEKALQAGRGLFDYASLGQFEKNAQKFARSSTHHVERDAPDAFVSAAEHLAGMKEVQDKFFKEYDPYIRARAAQQGVDYDDLAKETWQSTMQHSLERSFPEAAHRFGGVAPSPELSQLADTHFGNMRNAMDNSRAELESMGVKIGDTTTNELNFAHRVANQDYLDTLKAPIASEGLLTFGGTRGRSRLIAHIPQMDLVQMAKNHLRYTGHSGVANIKADFGKYLGQVAKKDGTLISPHDHAVLLKRKLKSDLLAFNTKHPGKTFAGWHELAPEGLYEKYRQQSARIGANAKAIHETLIGAIQKVNGKPSLRKSPGTYTPKAAFRRLGMDPSKALDYFASALNESVDVVKKYRLDSDVVAAIANVKQSMMNKPWMDFLGKHVDSFNRMFKSGVTLPFPSFHMRNWISGQHMNLASEHLRTIQDYGDYIKAYQEAMKLRGLDESHPLIREAMAHKVLDPFRAFQDVELPGSNSLSAKLTDFKAPYQQAKDWVAENPEGTWMLGLDKHLPKQLREGLNTITQYGSNVARATEFMNRMPMFLYLRKKGLSAADAAREVGRLQIDYSKVGQMEKSIGKRLFPFYGFTRGIVPQIARMLADAPGGKMAQTIRASNAAREKNEVLPTEIASQAAVPLGTMADGTKQYLSGFGLTTDASTPFLGAPLGLENAQGAGLEALSMMTPLVKGPLEAATGQTFFQRGLEGGRPLRELNPTLAQIGANLGSPLGIGQSLPQIAQRTPAWMAFEHALANTPGSKGLTTARTLTDQRKYGARSILGVPDALTNTLTPLRVTAVSPQRQERLLQQASNVLADSLGAKSWKNRYFRKEDIAAAEKDNPLVAAQMKELNRLWAESKRQAIKYRKAAQVSGKKPS